VQPDGTVVKRFAHATAGALSADAHWLAVIGSDGLKLFDVKTLATVARSGTEAYSNWIRRRTILASEVMDGYRDEVTRRMTPCRDGTRVPPS
jgi:hypothetical protein